MRTANNAGIAIKPDDRFAVPLCTMHHHEAHQGARSFAVKYRLDLLAEAARYAQSSGQELLV